MSAPPYPAPKNVNPIFNPLDFNTTINTVSSSFSPAEQIQINGLIADNKSKYAEIENRLTLLGKLIVMGNDPYTQLVYGNTPTVVFNQIFDAGTYLFSCCIPFQVGNHNPSSYWTYASLSAPVDNIHTTLSQTQTTVPPLPQTNATIGAISFTCILSYQVQTTFRLTMNITSSGGINDQWLIANSVNVGFSPLQPGTLQNMFRCCQISGPQIAP